MSFSTTAVGATLPFSGNLATAFDQPKRKKESSCIPDIVWLAHTAVPPHLDVTSTVFYNLTNTSCLRFCFSESSVGLCVIGGARSR